MPRGAAGLSIPSLLLSRREMPTGERRAWGTMAVEAAGLSGWIGRKIIIRMDPYVVPRSLSPISGWQPG